MLSIKQIHRLWQKICLLLAFLIAGTVVASDLAIYQPAQNGQVTMVMMLDTSGSMGDGTGYSSSCSLSGTNWCTVSSIIGDYGFYTSSSNNYTTACTKSNTYSSTTKKWTYNNPYSNTQDTNSGYSFQLVLPAATVNGQALPSVTLNYCPAPTVAIGQSCYATANYLSTIAPSIVSNLPQNAINGYASGTSQNSTNGVSGTVTTGGGIGTYCFTRVSRLKMGMIGVLINNSNAVQNTIMGVGHFSAPNGTSSSSTPAQGNDGEILVPAVLLGPVNATSTTSQRYILANTIAQLVAWNGTPTAAGYAEAAAYLLGNKASPTGFSYSKSNSVAGAGGVSALNSGGSAYNSPVVANKATSCGQGVYILSDGEPNAPGASTVQPYMASALGTSFSCPSAGSANTATTYGSSTASLLSSYNTTAASGSAWECMGAFAQALNNGNSLASDGLKYPIQTAFVGFGTDFDQLTTIPASPLLSQNGSNYYYDALNVCELASRPGSSDQCGSNVPATTTSNPNGGYGDGGFYKAKTPDQVTASVTGFIQTLSQAKVPPLSTGAASIPFDSLNPVGFEAYGYVRALLPNPADNKIMSWAGNIKKYNMSGTSSSTVFLNDAKGQPVFNTNGTLVDVSSSGVITPKTYDLWNSYGQPDGGVVVDSTISGTAYKASGTADKIPMPKATTSTVTNTLRQIFLDVDQATGKDLWTTDGTGSTLTALPPKAQNPLSDTTLLGFFTGTSTLAPFNAVSTPASPVTNLITAATQIQLLNYLGYNLPLTTTLPSTATSTTAQSTLTNNIATIPYLGGTIHGQPITITYAGQINTTTQVLSKQRTQALLYGSMDGAIHLADDSTDSNGNSQTSGGAEIMTFLPNEIMSNTVASQAMKANVDNAQTVSTTAAAGQHAVVAPVPSQGADGPWTVDAAYKTSSSGLITASKLNVYGGLRMGGSSFYGLDISTCSTASSCLPKLLFRIGPTSGNTAYSTMGQSWSKPALANVRVGNKITRVMIVGGGYDLCYENPQFQVGSTMSGDLTGCSGISAAAGNAVYLINANTGALVWMFSNTCPVSSCTADTDMVDSIPGSIATLDRNGDGLIDHLYFADLGGKVYRADMNNTYATSGTTTFGVRVVTLAKLSTTAGNAPRFYEQPTVTFHQYGSYSFIEVGVASGDRSNPLDIVATQNGGQGLTGRNVNYVYGIMDLDFAKNLIPSTGTYTAPTLTATMTPSNLQLNPQTGGAVGGSLLTTNVISQFLVGGGTKLGWYRSLSADYTGKQLSNKTSGGMKAFERPYALTGNLLVPVYDPEGTSVASTSACSPRVIGETDFQAFCLPFGACVSNTTGLLQTNTSGTLIETGTGAMSNPTSSGTLIGPGIRNLQIASVPTSGGSCNGLTISNNQSSTGNWTCTRNLIPTRWYEKLPNTSRVK